ncbi:hypothetical protein B0H17DRAFT_216476 [Mycena rosella]|uniref:Uncharacterized protein n=1 Tax=Mycena rosella TaxID=1033263 RepID=A0AAD7CXH1_MYCRO|nr:hypothetical protein B0H17DRAFT_216476 [Mycena rosella]
MSSTLMLSTLPSMFASSAAYLDPFWDLCTDEGTLIFYHYHWGLSVYENVPANTPVDHAADKCLRPVASVGEPQLRTKEVTAISLAVFEALSNAFPDFPTQMTEENQMTGDKVFESIRAQLVYAIPDLMRGPRSDPKCLVVFEEFKELVMFLESLWPQEKTSGLVYIAGSEGIGKTYSLYYILLTRLWKAEPVILSRGQISYFFSEEGVHISYESPNSEEARLWALANRVASSRDPRPDPSQPICMPGMWPDRCRP